MSQTQQNCRQTQREKSKTDFNLNPLKIRLLCLTAYYMVFVCSLKWKYVLICKMLWNTWRSRWKCIFEVRCVLFFYICFVLTSSCQNTDETLSIDDLTKRTLEIQFEKKTMNEANQIDWLFVCTQSIDSQ